MPASDSAPRPPSADDEALRRNTDCVYFLASPLTCKKGSECEYRHSDIARVNPRDCWFWVNRNCLNPKCGFRHPPLDGLLGTQAPTSSGPTARVPSGAAAPAANAFTKQGVACIFFQKGFCLKGDWCPFLHGPDSVGNKASLVTGAASAAEPAAMTEKIFNVIDNSLQDKKALPMHAAKSVKDAQRVKPVTRVEPSPWGNEFAMNNRELPQDSGNLEFTAYKAAPLVSNGNPVSWPSHVQESPLLEVPESVYEKDIEEVSREPSPGFDVLVDDEGRDSDYYPGEDRYRMSMEHEARNEYDMDHSSDYNLIAVGDDERYVGSLGHDSHDPSAGGQYAWEQGRASSERISGGSYLERRLYNRPDSCGRMDESDLRHRLANPRHRNPNALRSMINREHNHDMQVEDQSYLEKSLSSRLRGRIRLPQRRSSSPVRVGASPCLGIIRNRMKGRAEEALNDFGKNLRGMHSRRDTFSENNNTDFAGPKSLAELKNRKNAKPVRQQATNQPLLGKRKHSVPNGKHQQSGGGLSFDGPKPLEEILKRKRGINLANNRNENCKEKDSTKNDAQKTDPEERREAASTSPGQPIVENQADEETETHDLEYGQDYDDVYGGENGEEYVVEEEDDENEFAKKMGVA